RQRFFADWHIGRRHRMIFRFSVRIMEKEELVAHTAEYDPVRLFLAVKAVGTDQQQHARALSDPLFELSLAWRRIDHFYIFVGQSPAKVRKDRLDGRVYVGPAHPVDKRRPARRVPRLTKDPPACRSTGEALPAASSAAGRHESGGRFAPQLQLLRPA